MAARVSKHWSYNPTLDIKEFNQKEVNDKNLVNMMLVLTQKDITSSFIMNTFGSFNGAQLIIMILLMYHQGHLHL